MEGLLTTNINILSSTAPVVFASQWDCQLVFFCAGVGVAHWVLPACQAEGRPSAGVEATWNICGDDELCEIDAVRPSPACFLQ